MKKFLLLVASISFICAESFGQVYGIISPTPNGNSKDFTPGSASAGSLGVYGQIPTGNFTGLPGISVPIYSIKYNELVVPIRINYHAAGNKPDNFPGSLGLGWSLHGPGAITRVIRGRPDEGGDLYDGDGQLQKLDFSPTDRSDWSSNQRLNEMMLENVAWATDISNPDEYYFNFNGMSGKFYIDEKGIFRVQSSENIQFHIESEVIGKTFYTPLLPQYVINSETWPGTMTGYYLGPYSPTFSKGSVLYKFIITDQQGVKYTFGGTDESIEFSRKGVAFNEAILDYNKLIMPITWNLTSIESPNGYEIILLYKRGVSVTKVGYSDVPRVIWQKIGGETTTKMNRLPTAKGEKSTMVLTSTIEKIITPLEILNFKSTVASNQLGYDSVAIEDIILENDFRSYKDIRYTQTLNLFPNKIDAIEISDAMTENLVKSVDFQYTSNKNTRLKLLSLSFKGSDLETYEQYKFEYNPNGPLLPRYISYKTDLYGFYSGDKSLDPNYKSTNDYLQLQDVNKEATYIQSREPDENFTKAEILTKIIYPTGGATVFEYESNRYGSSVTTWPFSSQVNPAELGRNVITGGLRIAKVSNLDLDGKITSEKSYYYTKNFAANGANNSEPISSGVLAYKPSFFEKLKGTVTAPSHIVGGNFNGNIDFWQFSNNPIFPMAETRGNHVTYTEVTEKDSNGSLITYKFKNYDNGFGDHQPINWATDNTQLKEFWKEEEGSSLSLERGQLISEENFNASKELVKKIVYEYNDDPQRFSDNNKNIRVLAKSPNSIQVAIIPSKRYTARLIYIYFPYIKEKKVYNYFPNGIVEDFTTYSYDLTNKLLKETNFNTSKGNSVKIINRYVNDMVQQGQTEPYQKMLDQHMEGVLIETEKLVDSERQYLSIKKFSSNWNNNPNMILPEILQEQIGQGPLQTKLRFNSYDSQGNVQSTTNTHGINSSLIRGNNQTATIALINNASLNQVAYTSFENESSKGGWDYEYRTTDVVKCSSDSYNYCITFPPSIIKNESVTGDYSFTHDIKGAISKYNLPTGNYIVSFWAKVSSSAQGSVDVNFGSDSKSLNVSSSSWKYFEISLYSITSVTLNLSSVLIDELRLFPQTAQIETFYHLPLIGIKSQSNTNGKISHYRYDAFGRLNLIMDEEKNIIKKYSYKNFDNQ